MQKRREYIDFIDSNLLKNLIKDKGGENVQKKLIIMSLFMVFMVLLMAGSVFAQDQAVEANKTAQVTGVDTATVYIGVNGSSNSTRLPADVVFAIDASGSMSTSDPTGLRKTGAISFINKMNNTTDKVGVVNWANVIKQQQGLTSDFTQAINVVNQNTPGGTTNGALAMETSINILSLSSLPANQRNIILLTDGLFNAGGNSTATPDQRAIFFATLAKSLGYNVYTIGLGPDVDPVVLTQMASVINGVPQYYFANNASVIDSIYNQIFQSITTKAKNITVTDVVPNYMTYVGATIAPTTNVLNPDGTRTLTWFIPTLGQGQNWNVSYDLMSTINGFNIPTNIVANVTYTDPENNTGNLTLPIPLVDFPANLDVTKEGTPEPIWPGSLLTYHMLIENNGPHTAWDVSFRDTIPADLDSAEYSLNNINWNPYTSEQNVPLGNLAVGQTVTFWIRGIIDINAPVPGTIINTVSAYLNGTFNNNATVINNLIPAADLAIIKTANQTQDLISGQNVTFTLQVTNFGPNNANNVMAYDSIPTGIASFGAATPSQGIWYPLTGIWDIGTLTVGQIVTLTFNATISNPFLGNITNIANVTGTEFDPNPLNNQDVIELFVNTPYVPTADLTISKTVDHPTPNFGDTIHFTVTVFNAGPDPAQNVVVTDVWPTGLIFVSSTPVPSSIIGNIYTWNLGTLGHQQNATINITAIVNATGLITNFVNVTTTTFDPHPTDNNATANVIVGEAAHVVLNKTVDNSTPDYWSLVTFTIAAFNTGPNDAQGVEVTDILPAGLTYVSSIFTPGTTYNSNTGIWNIGTIFNGTSAFLSITANVTGIGTITNWAYVTNQTTFDNQTWSEDNETINVPSASIFALHKEWRAFQDGTPITTAQYQDNVWVVFSATNLGPSFATITLSDILPPGFTPGSYYQWKIDSGIWNNEPITWPGSDSGPVSVGSTIWIAIPGQITVANTTLNNTVNQTSQDTYNPEYPQGPPYGNASAQLDIPPHSHIVITKTVNNSTPNYGSTIIFTVTAHNNGPNDASGVQVVDNLPTGLVFVSYLSSQGVYDSTTGIWNIGTLLNNTIATLNITALVNATGNMTNWANEANATINVPAAADLEITKTVSNPRPYIHEVINFTLIVQNKGPDTATSVYVTDKLPEGVVYISSSANYGSYDPNTGIWTIGDLPSGAVAQLVMNVGVEKVGPLENHAHVYSNTYDPILDNQSASATVDVQTTPVNAETVNAGTVPMQKTGVPLGALLLALLLVLSGVISAKRK